MLLWENFSVKFKCEKQIQVLISPNTIIFLASDLTKTIFLKFSSVNIWMDTVNVNLSSGYILRLRP